MWPPAPAHFPACFLHNYLPELPLLGFPPAAVTGDASMFGLTFPHTTSHCHSLGIQIVWGKHWYAHARTLVVRISLWITFCLPLALVCYYLLCPLVYSQNVYHICWPPTRPLLLILLQRSVWHYSKPKCIAALLWYICQTLWRCSPGGLLLCLPGCLSSQGPNGSPLRCYGRGGPVPFHQSVMLLADHGLAQDLPSVEWQHVNHYILQPASQNGFVVYSSSRLSHQAPVQSLTARHQRSPYVKYPQSCGGTSIQFRVRTQLGLLLGCHLSMIHLSTTSRPRLQLRLLSLLPSAARHCWLWFCHPAYWSSPLHLCLRTTSSCLQFSGHGQGHFSLLCISVHPKRWFGVTPLSCWYMHLPV